MAEHAKKALPPLIEEELSRLPKDADDNLVGEALKRAFEATDQGWVDCFWGLVKKDKRTAESRVSEAMRCNTLCTSPVLLNNVRIACVGLTPLRRPWGRARCRR